MRVHMEILAPCLPSGCIGRDYRDGCVTERSNRMVDKRSQRSTKRNERTFMSVRQASHRAIRHLMLRVKALGERVSNGMYIDVRINRWNKSDWSSIWSAKLGW